MSGSAGAQRSLRISFVTLAYAPSIGGSQHHVRRLAEGLHLRGHQVQVITTDALRSPTGRDPGRAGPAVEELGGVQVRRCRTWTSIRGVARRVRWLRWRLSPRRADEDVLHPLLAGPWVPSMLREVRAALRSSDVVVACSSPFLTLVAPLLLARRGGARVVAMPLLHVSRSQPHRVVARALRSADGVMASTDRERRALVDAGVDEHRIRVVPPGVDLPTGSRASAALARSSTGLPERPTVGYVGRLAAYKGIDTLLAAAPLVWDRWPEVTVLVAGARTGWAGHRDRELAAVADGRLVVREDVEDEERDLLLRACDVVVVPSRDESFGLVVLEAWAAHRPVVASDIPVLQEIIAPGRDGELVPVGDHVALASAVSGLLGDPGHAAALADAGHDRVAREHTWPTIVRNWAAALDELVPAATRAG